MWLAAMDSAPALKATSPKKPGIILIKIQDIQQAIQDLEEDKML